MSEKKARIMNAKDSTANWNSANPTLLDGELGFEVKSNNEVSMKVGNGNTDWKNLKPAYYTPSEVDKKNAGLQNQIDNIVTSSTGTGDATAEVVQARVDETGTSHTTLKERIDTGVSSLKEDLNHLGEHIAVNGNYSETVTFGTEKGFTTNAYLIKGIKYKIKNVNTTDKNMGVWILGYNGEQSCNIAKGTKKEFTPISSGLLRIYDSKATEGSTATFEVYNESQVQFDDIKNQVKGNEININKTSGQFDLNDCVPNQIYNISITNALNSPVSDGGVCFITAFRSDVGYMYSQFFVDTNGTLYTRFKKYGTQGWSEWNEYLKTTSGALIPSEININKTSGQFDLNDCVPNQSYIISISNAKHTPVNNGGLCFAITYSKTSTSMYPQFFIDLDGALYTRFKKYNGTWTEWVSYEKSGGTGDIKTYAKLSMFDRVGVVGDSYASGALFNSSGKEIGEYPKISWIQQLARRNGFTGVNFSKGGLSTKTWLTDANGLSKLNSETACDLYILALGINDYWLEAEGYIGTEADITTKANSFYGNYTKIIEAIKAKAPTARIVMCTLAGTDTKPVAFSEAIRNIANHYNLPIAEPLSDPYFKSAEYTQMKYGGHPTITSYAAMATAYENVISKAMFNYFDYFEQGDYSK